MSDYFQTVDVKELAPIKEEITEKEAQDYVNQFEPYIGKEPPRIVIDIIGSRERYLAFEAEVVKNLEQLKKDFPKVVCTAPPADEYEDRKDIGEVGEVIR